MAKESKKRRGRGEGAVFQRADGVWTGSLSMGYGPDGKRQRVTVYGRTKKEAQEKLLKLQQDALQGLPVKPERITVQEHLTDWLLTKKGQVRSGTFLRYRFNLEKHVIPFLGSLRLRDLDYRRINALYAKLDEQGLAPRTVFDVASILRSALEDAVAKGLIPRNPAKLAAKRSPGRHEARFMTPEEVRWFLEGARGERLEDGFILALNTGCRPGEWLGLPWDAVDLSKGAITIRQALHEENGQVFIGPVKTKAAQRTIALPQAALEALHRQRRRQAEERLRAGAAWENTGLVFTNEKGGMLRRTNVDGRDLGRVIRNARRLAAEEYEKAGATRTDAQAAAEKLLAGVKLHTFRHTHAALLLAQGVDVMSVSRRLGHENIRITLDLYGHLMPGQDEKAARAMDQFTAELTEIGYSLATVGAKSAKTRKIPGP
ncbi:MAG: tyrosine-type recombinase/integrase [Bacillota bacterium]|nr:tyrosine-type recombinase/integrase [Bacillota bacterium]